MKLGTNVNNGYSAYQNQAAAAYLSIYFFIFFVLFNSQSKKVFSGTVRCTKLKLGTHGDNGLMYCVYWNLAVVSYLSLYFFVFLSNFQTL